MASTPTRTSPTLAGISAAPSTTKQELPCWFESGPAQAPTANTEVAIPVPNSDRCCFTCTIVEVRSLQNVPLVDVGLDGIIPVQVLLALVHLPALHHLQPLRVVPSKLLRLDFFSPFLIIFLVKTPHSGLGSAEEKAGVTRNGRGIQHQQKMPV